MNTIDNTIVIDAIKPIPKSTHVKDKTDQRVGCNIINLTTNHQVLLNNNTFIVMQL